MNFYTFTLQIQNRLVIWIQVTQEALLSCSQLIPSGCVLRSQILIGNFVVSISCVAMWTIQFESGKPL